MNAIVGILNDIASLWAGQMWTIIWQSTVLAGLVVIVTLLFRRLSAAVKFWLWMLVPLRLLVMPLITISLPLLPAIAPPHIEHMKTAPAVVEKAPVEYSPVRMANFEFPQEALNFQTRPVEIREQETEPDIIRIKLNLWFFLLITWFAGVGFWTIRLFWSWRKIRLIVGNAKKTEHQRIIRQASKAAAIAGLKNVPEILVTRGNISPFLFGILRPVLIVPSDFVNNVSNEGLLAVFSHEFAHLRRKDTLVGWILAICEAFYFFHPVLHFAKRRILFERERACDDWVIASGNSHKKIYANALIDAAGICRNFSAKLGPTGVVAESFGDLKKRIIAIGSNIKPKTRLSKTALVLLILTGTICVPGFVLTNRTIASSEKATLETVREMVARNEALINPIKMEYTVKYERKGELPSLNTGGGMRGSGRLSTYSEHTWAQDGKKNYSKGQNFYGPNEPSRGEIYIFDDKVTAFGALPDLMRGEIRDHDRFDWYFVLVVKLGLRPFEGEFRLNEILVPDYATLNNKTEIISGRETYVVDAGWPPHSLYFARIWIDKQRGMPLRIWYYKEHPTRTSQKTMSEINNIELYQLPNGAWLPIKGTRSNNLTSYISYEHISVDVNSVTTKRDDIPESLFEIDFPDGARVHNVFTGFISIKGKQLKTYEEIVGGTGSYIAGTIVDANDAAVPDVVVRPQTIRVEQSDGRSNYRILQPEEVSCAVTDSQGRFAVELNEEGIYEFDIYPKDLSEASVRVPLGEHNLKIVLEKGGTIKGRVVSLKKGRKIPLPNIEVEVESERFVTLRTNRLKAVTDSDGRFEIKYLSTHLSPRTDNPQEYRPRPWQIHCGSHTQTVVFEEGVSNKEVEILLRPDIDSAAPLTGKSLPSFDEIKLDYDINQAKDKKVLICFFDLEQRPARNCLLELSKQADDLAQQGISVIAVHASEIGKDILDAWLKENNITIPVGIVEGDEQQLRFNWAIQSLPWLILTDWKHIVRFEGFSIDELNDKIQECSEWDVIEGYVRDPNGKPIENVEVRIDRDSPEYYPPEITQTDEHGYYSIPKPEWSYTILSQWTEILDSNDGQRRQMIKLKRIFDGPQTINFQFNSFPDEDTILGGKVVDNSDNPVSDYKIWIIDSDYRDDPNKDYICKFDYTLEKTFESGIFRITGLSPGDYHISVFPKSKTYEETVFLDVTLENNKVSDNTIRLNSKKAFYGRVLFEDGSPAILPDLKTDITEPMGEASWATLASLDNDGYFEVLLSEREIQEFQTSKKQLWVLLKRYHIGMFPFDLLTPEHDKAKIVKVNRPEVVIEPENVLVGKLLPELKNFGIDLSLFDMKDKKVLVCFFDSEQRPARNCLLELSKRADDLARQGISIIAVHASKIEKNTLDTWLKENNITMPVGIVEDDSEQIRFNWAIQSLPWLILTNTKHIVTDDGFSIDEIEEKIKNINENPALETINSKELLENLKSMDEIYTSSLTLTGTDIRIPDYPDVPRQKIRWKISMHQDEFALEQISDEIYERKSS
ncbi:MAG: redoxin domain-containing protein, partial [Sedimentisphaerales bacterium]|nr:redoxin domain-containing protein [Sedimentisphaerales bacterium]